ncbi:F0F1 ATP synthase subunit B [Oscillatoriales cyanobacterium LEGE 11467]|uniref:ATP synthase subunit b n=1 Tax=Zarconia navalis LEGE 11467 TaxID=1828826 RepID=A0A928W1J7_9CYAN|nr:F0F1 ATP synthase subunit B [Zarconia navalis]MBE9042286.1 F0F1 ATP synthase subunit B [Zarconia navalis LEGE 11467]
METFLWLATEEKGFGLHFNLLESNIVNLAIIISVLVYFGRGILTKALGERRANIETSIKEVEQRAQAAKVALSDAQQQLTQAQAEAGRIRSEAQERAKSAKEAVMAQSEQEIERMKASASQDLNADRERAIAELRTRVTAMAIESAEAQLKERMDRSAQEKSIDRSIALLGGKG